MKLELKNICQAYGRKSVIKNMNLEFEPGIYGFLGPNGAGKSTTIRMICTVENPVSGEICYGGKDIYSMGADYRGKLGYVPQKAGYYPDYTAGAFLRYVARLKDIADRVMILAKGKIQFNEYTEDALQQVTDTVWECKLNDIEKIKYIREHYKISKMQRHKGFVDLRVISDTKPCEEAVTVQGSLEELYMQMVG